MAIARSGTPNATVTGGALNGFTYKQVAQMAVDWLASAQLTTGDANGAWYYDKAGTFGDQSATGWVGMGLGYAAHSMGCTVPADTLTRLSTWNDFIQSTTPGPTFGGAAYTSSDAELDQHLQDRTPAVQPEPLRRHRRHPARAGRPDFHDHALGRQDQRLELLR